MTSGHERSVPDVHKCRREGCRPYTPAQNRSQTPVTGRESFCYLSGLPFEDYRPVNAGMLVPAGSDMIVSRHYTAPGPAGVDRSRVGFTVTKTSPAKKFTVV